MTVRQYIPAVTMNTLVISLDQRNQMINGSLFVYPVEEDKAVFNMKQVIGKTAEPELQRRDVLKFEVDIRVSK